ncbi:hypothetical protein [Streptomyces finlayi]|uniref:hypothetical protein n=1 Tax=Streptomyces finlayi TaxID=67296 RepID=UPI002156489B|nr:hypothetical protein [Streptomyces finlayi]
MLAHGPISPGEGGTGQVRSAVTLHVNGTARTLTLDHRAIVLDALRRHLGLTGAKAAVIRQPASGAVPGIGDFGIVGAAAAIGNAVRHATGSRLRALPLTPDKLLPYLPYLP